MEHCAIGECAAESLLWLKGVPMCEEHYHELQRRLAASGLAIGPLTGRIVKLAAKGVGRVLSDESRVARAALDRVRLRSATISEIEHTRRQLDMLRGGPQDLAAPAGQGAEPRLHELQLRLIELRRALAAGEPRRPS